MEGDGKHRRRLPADHVLGASWSPDGHAIAFDLLGKGSRPNTYRRDVWTMDVDGGARYRRVVRNGITPDWSPNGRSLAFQRGGTTLGGDIWVADLNGRGQRRVIRHGRQPRWSPDGKKLAFERGGARSDIWIAELGANTERRLVRNGEAAIWSPDGRQIAFDRCRTEGATGECFIYVIRADGTEQRRLFEGEEPLWSPTGAEIVFVGADARRHFYDAIIRRRVDGSDRRVLFGQQPYCGCFLLTWGPSRRNRR